MTAMMYAENAFLSFVAKQGVSSLMRGGCVVGFSGGADSLLLTVLTARYAKKQNVPFVAVHVNHGIRGEEALRDEEFCRSFAQANDIRLEVYRKNVPLEAEQSGEGIEEAARRVRYSAFADACHRYGYACILTAHHADDVSETVLLHLVRGSGINGLGGIPSLRQENGWTVLRPMLGLTREEIEEALAEESLTFVKDSTNGDVRYRRNFVRHEILPRLKALNPSFEKSVLRMCENAAMDEDFLQAQAWTQFDVIYQNGYLPRTAVLSLHPSMRYRVLLLLYKKNYADAAFPERVHTDAFFERLEKDGDFLIPFPQGICACVKGDCICFCKDEKEETYFLPETPFLGQEMVLADGGRIGLVKASAAHSLNVYKLSIHRDLSSATISGGMYVRSKKDGDAYFYGGVTHKLKKLFSDAKIPQKDRMHLPVLCDEKGILWVPHFGVREDGGKEEKDVTLYYIPPNSV